MKRSTIIRLRRVVHIAIIANIIVWVVTACRAFVFGCKYFLVLIGPGEISLCMDAQTAKATIGFGVSWDIFSWEPQQQLSEWFQAPFIGRYAACIPFWLTALGLMGLSLFLRTAYRRKLSGSCLHCEYDLQGNQSGVCPECGEAVEVTA